MTVEEMALLLDSYGPTTLDERERRSFQPLPGTRVPGGPSSIRTAGAVLVEGGAGIDRMCDLLASLVDEVKALRLQVDLFVDSD